MGMFHSLKVGTQTISPIDWEMTPELTFGTYESWGGRERVRNNNECVYYFFVDNWGEKPKLFLMERAVKHAKIIAEIHAPPELVKQCVDAQGTVAFYDRTFAIDPPIRDWLIDHVLDDDGDASLVFPVAEGATVEDMGARLPVWDGRHEAGDLTILPTQSRVLSDEDVERIIKENNFFDAALNPTGRFDNHLHDSGSKTIVDQRTGLMWQRGGLDIMSMRSLERAVAQLNRKGLAGFNDWRLPALEEAMSLLEPKRNEKGVYLNSNFSTEQPFVFVASKRKPGGYWFVDFKQGRAFWSSGTIPGGFGRLCRTA